MADKKESARKARVKPSKQTEGKTKASSRVTGVNDEEKRELIGKAAYYRAERRGFIPGFELDDWLAAEHEIEGSLQIFTAEPDHLKVRSYDKKTR